MRTARILVNPEGFKRACRRSDGITVELASRLGCSSACTSRLLRGKHEPSSRFIAAALAEFGIAEFAHLFTLADAA